MYAAEELKKNRVSALVFGGSETDRRAFAEAAAENASEAFVEAKDADSLGRALKGKNGVVYVPDVTALPFTTQREVVRVLREQEERPKLVLGLGSAPDTARDKGTLTEDLVFWLKQSTVDVKARASRR